MKRSRKTGLPLVAIALAIVLVAAGCSDDDGGDVSSGTPGVTERMKLTLHTTAGNKRRELTAQILQSSLKDVGIELEIITEKAGDLFGKRLPAGDFQLALYAQVPPSDKPSQCDLFCSKGIPGPSNNNTGQNYTRTNNPEIDKALEALDVETDEAKRKQLADQAQNAIAADVTSLPVDPFPDIVGYNPAKVGGPIGHNLAFGPWWNMHEWFLKTSPAQTSPAPGGELVFGAEQEADCADWIGSCAGASWGIWALGAHTMPRSFEFTLDGHKPSELLAGEPTLELTGGKQIVTYKLNPAAKWSDGRPITSADYQYTWDQIKNGKDIYDTTGYREIESVDATDPRTAKVTFSKPYGDWKDLFGGFFGIYPKHLLEGKDRNAEMKDGYKFSGGPWVLDRWTKGQEIVLTPNPNWYGAKKPNLTKVTFKFTTDTSAEISNFKSKQLDVIYPQAQPEMKDLLGVPDLKVDVVTSLNYEGIWMNNAKPPLNDPKVREAIFYAVDREAILTGLFRPIQPDIKVINSFMTPANKKYYGVEPFAKYKYDKNQAAKLLADAGWKKAADGVFEKRS